MPSFCDYLFLARIMAFTANPRNGKTRLMVDLAKDAQKLNPPIPIYADFHIAGINCDKITAGQSPIDYPEDNHYISSFDEIKNKTFPKGSVLLLDELIKRFDNRLTMGKGEETKARAKLTQAFMQIGKKHLRVCHAEQISRTIDWRIAYLSELFIVPRPRAFKIVDNEIINVEFEVTPVVNEGIFGFQELPHYIMNEQRFWLHAFDYDSDEPVLDDEEIAEIKAKRDAPRLAKEKAEKERQDKIDSEIKEKEEYNNASFDEKQKIRAHKITEKKQLSLNQQKQTNNSNTENNQTSPENSEVGINLINPSIFGNRIKIIGQSHYTNPGENKTIVFSNWQIPNVRQFFPNEIEYPQFKDLLAQYSELIYN